MFPLFLTAETIIVKTKVPQNSNAVFQYRVPKGYDKYRREMYRVLVIFGGRHTDGKADAGKNSLPSPVNSAIRPMTPTAWANIWKNSG